MLVVGGWGTPESRAPSFTSHSRPLTDELQKLLLEQMELRKKLEREFQSLKGTPTPTHLTPPHPTSAREPSPCAPGAQARQPRLRAPHQPPNPAFPGLPARPETEGVGAGMGSGEMGPRGL